MCAVSIKAREQTSEKERERERKKEKERERERDTEERTRCCTVCRTMPHHPLHSQVATHTRIRLCLTYWSSYQNEGEKSICPEGGRDMVEYKTKWVGGLYTGGLAKVGVLIEVVLSAGGGRGDVMIVC